MAQPRAKKTKIVQQVGTFRLQGQCSIPVFEGLTVSVTDAMTMVEKFMSDTFQRETAWVLTNELIKTTTPMIRNFRQDINDGRENINVDDFKEMKTELNWSCFTLFINASSRLAHNYAEVSSVPITEDFQSSLTTVNQQVQVFAELYADIQDVQDIQDVTRMMDEWERLVAAVNAFNSEMNTYLEAVRNRPV